MTPKETIFLVDQGREIKADRNAPIEVPKELQIAIRRYKGATASFKNMPRGLQREYADYVVSAKRDDTKQKRIEKILPKIVAGRGLNDKYR